LALDQEIYIKLLGRDEAGISLLYDNYADALNGIAYRILRNESFAEDAVQKSFLKIWNGIEQYDPEKSTLFTWMAQIVRNTAIDTRRLVSFQKEEKSETYDARVHNTETTSTSSDSLDSTTLISGLDEKYAFVLEHLYLKGYTQSELSKEYGIPLGTIKSRVKKGIDILRTKLDKEKKYFIGLFLMVLIIIFFIK